jgi:starvation-inducible DNA-binding protein
MSKTQIPELLNQLLATTVDFYYTYKYFHWNITTQDFYQFHLLFDEHAGIIYTSQDIIAERIRQLDCTANGFLKAYSNQSVVSHTEISPNDNIQEVLKFIHEQHLATIKLLEKGIKASNEGDDYATADLLTTFLEQHQKMAWFIRSSIKN